MNFKKLDGDRVDNLSIDSYLVRMGRQDNDYRYFIVYNNYLNILSYNCSNYYALSVGLLSDQIN
jgi:membrane-bound lytic murein transglycosylase B